MKKIIIICLYSLVACASDYDHKKVIAHLEKLTRVALQNGLDTVADSYRAKVCKLVQAQQETFVQQKVLKKAEHKASL